MPAGHFEFSETEILFFKKERWREPYSAKSEAAKGHLFWFNDDSEQPIISARARPQSCLPRCKIDLLRFFSGDKSGRARAPQLSPPKGGTVSKHFSYERARALLFLVLGFRFVCLSKQGVFIQAWIARQVELSGTNTGPSSNFLLNLSNVSLNYLLNINGLVEMVAGRRWSKNCDYIICVFEFWLYLLLNILGKKEVWWFEEIFEMEQKLSHRNKKKEQKMIIKKLVLKCFKICFMQVQIFNNHEKLTNSQLMVNVCTSSLSQINLDSSDRSTKPVLNKAG